MTVDLHLDDALISKAIEVGHHEDPVTVLVDTTIWSLALRRRPDQLSPSDLELVSEWQDLAETNRAVLTGIIRQEVLSGIRARR